MGIAFDKVRKLINSGRWGKIRRRPLVSDCKMGNGQKIPKACLEQNKKQREIPKNRKKRGITSSTELIKPNINFYLEPFPNSSRFTDSNEIPAFIFALDSSNSHRIGKHFHGTLHDPRLDLWKRPSQFAVPAFLTFLAFIIMFGAILFIAERKRPINRVNRRGVRRRLSEPVNNIATIALPENRYLGDTRIAMPPLVSQDVANQSENSSVLDHPITLQRPLDTMILQLCQSFDSTVGIHREHEVKETYPLDDATIGNLPPLIFDISQDENDTMKGIQEENKPDEEIHRNTANNDEEACMRITEIRDGFFVIEQEGNETLL